MVMAKDVDKGPKSGQGELAGAPRWTGWSGVLLVAGAVLALVQAVLWLGCTSMESGTEKEVRTPGSRSSAMTSTRAGGGVPSPWASGPLSGSFLMAEAYFSGNVPGPETDVGARHKAL